MLTRGELEHYGVSGGFFNQLEVSMNEATQEKGALRVGSLFGIPFFIDASWFFILALVTFSYGSGLAGQFPEWQGVVPWLVGLIAALLLFASVLLHELGHSFAAMAQGIPVRSISLFLFGGVARIERESTSPWGSLGVALAGPLVSVALFGLFTGVQWLFEPTGGTAAILGLLASLNLALAVFNMLPGLPLDGGNALKAIVWAITGNQYKGIRVAAFTGQGVGLLMMAAGLFSALTSGFNGLWFALIGWFVFSNARSYGQYAQIQDKLSGLTAAEATVRTEPTVPVHASLRTFADFYALSTEQPGFLVTDYEGRLVGRISRSRLTQFEPEKWSSINVSEVMEPVDAAETATLTQPLSEVLNRLNEKSLPRIPVLYPDGRLVGQVRMKDIQRFAQGDRWNPAH